MPICPAGHQTQQSDFCDICGLPVPGGQTGLPAAPPPITAAAASPLICPNCQTPNVAEALFCEACGYDFTTGTMPAPVPSAVLPQPAAPAPGGPAQPSPSDPGLVDAILGPPPEVVEPVEVEPVVAAAPEPVVTEAAPLPEQTPQDAPSAPVDAAAQPVEPAGDPVAADTDEPAPAQASPSEPSGTAQPSEPAAPVARAAVEWVAELWIDPDWYAAQGSADPLPSPGLPDIVPLVKDANLVGRVSHSRGIFPDVDCELDTGCSRRHAMLTTDGTRWWIEDLNSANGTFVGAAAGPLPAMPIPQGRVELSPGQRIYVGAWTRIVIRRATDDEKEAFAG